jgi:GTP-dependent phosphoenolpyruvate carboxykinase
VLPRAGRSFARGDEDDEMTSALTENPHILAFVAEMAKLCQPDRIHWCDGSEEERRRLTAQAVDAGVLIPLNQEKLPGCYYHRSNPNDVARVEQCTYICTENEAEAGPTNNWAPPEGDEGEDARPGPRRHEGPDDVRHPVPHGAARARRCRRSASS